MGLDGCTDALLQILQRCLDLCGATGRERSADRARAGTDTGLSEVHGRTAQSMGDASHCVKVAVLASLLQRKSGLGEVL
jgi:hypothetical protein